MEVQDPLGLAPFFLPCPGPERSGPIFSPRGREIAGYRRRPLRPGHFHGRTWPVRVLGAILLFFRGSLGGKFPGAADLPGHRHRSALCA
jgi:hypothetical protein